MKSRHYLTQVTFLPTPVAWPSLKDKDNFYQKLIRGGEGPGSPMAAWCGAW